MSAKRLTLLVGVFALWGSAARADIHPSTAPAILLQPILSEGTVPGHASWKDAASILGDVGSGFADAYGNNAHHALSEDAPRWNPDDVRQLPAAPGSASLFLSAVLSIGAWNLVRSAKQIQLNIPEWYHTGGPDQIGSTVAFDLVFNGLVPCVFEDVLADQPSLRQPRRATQWRFEPRVFVADADPRGPPLGV